MYIPYSMPRSKDDWTKIGYDLLKGVLPSTVAARYRVSLATINQAIERFSETGQLHPMPPGGGKGKIRRAKRKTTQADEDKIEASLIKLRPTPEETTCNRIGVDTKLNRKMSRRLINKRCNERGYFWEKPRAKEHYTKDQMAARLAFALKHRSKSVDWWRKLAYTDEHDIVHSNGDTASRQLHARKRLVPIKAGESHLHNDVVAPQKGAMVKGGTHVKFAVAILTDKVVVFERVQKYIEKRKPPVPKEPKLSKNGKRIGRPPDDEAKKAKAKSKKFDSPAYAVFLEELAGVVREQLGLGPADTIFGLQDGAKFHWGEEAKQVIKDKKWDIFLDFPAYSPDLNPIENLFSILDGELAKLAVKKASTSVNVTVQRARKIATRVGDTDYIKNMVDSMPNRLEEVIKAKGGPTRY